MKDCVRPIASFASAHPALAIFVGALTARVVVAVGAWVVFGGIIFGDDGTYEYLARTMAAGETNVWTPREHWLYLHVGGYLVPLTAVYWVFGSSALAGQLLSGVFGAAAAAMTYLLANEIVSKRLAVTAGLIVALLPSQVLFSSLQLKDAEIWAALAAVAFFATKLMREPRGRAAIRWSVALALALLLTGFLRQHTHIIAVWALVPAFLFGSRHRRLLLTSGALAMAILFPWVSGLGPGGSTFVRSGVSGVDEIRDFMAMGANTAVVPDISAPPPAPTGTEDPLAPVDTWAPRESPATAARPDPIAPPRNAGDDGGLALSYSDQFLYADASEATPSTAYSDQHLAHDTVNPSRTPARAYSDQFLAHDTVDPPRVPARRAGSDNPVVDNLRHLPYGIVVALLEPLPWRDGNLRTDLARAEAIVWYPILLLGIIGLPRLLRRPSVGVYPVLVAGGVILVMALAEGNYGTAFRHRGDLVWATAVASVVGLEQIRIWVGQPQTPDGQVGAGSE